MWRLTYRWAVRSHPNKSKRWVVNRHFGAFNRTREDRWVFGDRESGRYLQKFSWTKIVRHQILPGRASPDDPALASYWSRRRRRQLPVLDRTTLRLLTTQRWRCPICTGLPLHAEHEPQAPNNGGSGSPQPVRQSATTRPTPKQVRGQRTNPPHCNWYTPTVHVGSSPTTMATSHFCPPASPRDWSENEG